MNLEKFSDFLVEQRKNHNMTQKQLAEILNVSISAISKWERGLCLPEISKLEDIAKAFDITLMEVMQCKINENNDNYNAEEIHEMLNDTIMYAKKEKKKVMKIMIIGIVVLALLFISCLPFYKNVNSFLLAYSLKKATLIDKYPCSSPLSEYEKLALFNYYIDNASLDGDGNKMPLRYINNTSEGTLYITVYEEESSIGIRYELHDMTKDIWYRLVKTKKSIPENYSIDDSDVKCIESYDYAKWSYNNEIIEYRNFWTYLSNSIFE